MGMLDCQQSRDPFRTRVVFIPQKVSQGVDFLELIREISTQLCLSDVGAINRFSDLTVISVCSLSFTNEERSFFLRRFNPNLA